MLEAFEAGNLPDVGSTGRGRMKGKKAKGGRVKKKT